MVKKPTYEELERRVEELEYVANGLAESEQQFRWIAENINEVFYVKDLSAGSYQYINPVFDGVFGVSREKLYKDSRYVFDVLVHPDDRERVNAAMQRQDERGEWFAEEYRILRPDGTIGWVWARSFPVSDEQGQVNRVVGIAEDITERKQLEYDIGERLKELQCLYSISRIAERAEIGLNKICQEVVKLLPPGWQYPEITCSRIIIDDSAFRTRNYRDTGWRQSADIELHGAKVGMVEVGYLEERPAIDEGPFLKEERALINAVAGHLATIVERKQGEDELKESEEKYRSLFENMLNGFAYCKILVDENNQPIDFIYLEVNDAFERLTGLRKEDIIGRKVTEAIPGTKESHPELFNIYGKVALTGEPTKFELHFEPLGIWLTISVYSPQKGYFAAVFDNITERKQAEEALRESEEKYRAIFQTTREGIIVSGSDGSVSSVNPAAVAMLGYKSPEKLVGQPAANLYAVPDQRETIIKAAMERGYTGNVEISLNKKDGMPVYVLANITVHRDEQGNILRTEGIFADITERKQLEQNLAEEKKRLEVTLRSTGDGVIACDIGGKITLLNRVAENLTGSTQDEAVGKQLEEVFHIVNERTRRRIKNPVQTVLKTGRVVGLINHAVLISRDGTERIIADSGAPIHDEEGNLFGVVLVFRDITEIRRLEEELQKLNKLESVGTLAGGIAHDFNNLLTGIMGNISLAKRYVEPKSKAEDRLLEAEKASFRARDLTQQLLTFASGGAPIKKMVSIAEIIKETADFALRGSNTRCEFSLPDDLWAVEIDEGQMSQVINNLIINADEAMPKGGTIEIGANNIVIRRRRNLPLAAGNYVEVTVQDHGVGIPQDILDRIFDPYFTTKQKGSGLGLATSFSIIRNHGGYITAESRVAAGTKFHIYLPASTKLMPEKEGVTAEAPVKGEGRILVMDDEEIIRRLLDAELTDAGYEVELTADGAEAIEHYTKAKESGRPFDAVILDLTVPGGIGGVETIKKLLEIDPDIKAIVSSGYSADPLMANFRDYGFSGVVAKPYSVAQLEKTLRSILRPKN